MQRENIGFDRRFRIAAVNIDRHAERLCDFSNALADCSVSDDSERTSGKLQNRFFYESIILGIFPSVLVDQAGIESDIIRHFKYECKGMLSHGFRRVGRDIADRDAFFLGGSDIDVVVTGSRHADEFKVRTCIHDFTRNFYL